MDIQKEKAIAQANDLRFDPHSKKGHYESYFLRANHPAAKEAFWIRYTIFSPKGKPEEAIGELWAVYFNGKEHFADKKEFPILSCSLNNTHFDLGIGDNFIRSHEAIGKTTNFEWNLEYESDQEPLFLLPLTFYNLPFPKAKAMVPMPFAKFKGCLHVNGKEIIIKDWIGSQNHNWGEKHTDYYAWGQVAGFDNYPNSFLEVVTAKLKIGPLSTPYLSMLVLRHEGKEYHLNTMKDAIASNASFGYFYWNFNLENDLVKISGRIDADKDDFVGLNYYNPPGGSKDCLNSKIAFCKIDITEKSKIGIQHELISANRTAFEILTDSKDHGIQINF